MRSTAFWIRVPAEEPPVTLSILSRDWLLDENPDTRMQAKFGQLYRMSRALMRNPLAVLGLLIIVALVVIAALAPWIAP